MFNEVGTASPAQWQVLLLGRYREAGMEAISEMGANLIFVPGEEELSFVFRVLRLGGGARSFNFGADTYAQTMFWFHW
ncbi:MAG TPA: hypothetical protein VHH73_00950 [Verrucomicrobiae bacterium]|nr:hypothetical protein [Verrucomicrobiae bacterium]